MQTFGRWLLLLVVLLASSWCTKASLHNGDALWSLQPLKRPVPPKEGVTPGWAHNPIDLFIEAKLTEKGLKNSALADKRTLIRRLYFDLIGLPPAPEEVERFLEDEGEETYERLVNRLLASPHYGERWARHWLDVVHYGETHGYDKDKLRPNAWPYRDYVIRSFNEDKPYWRFVQEQLAGDVLFPFTAEGIEALGFIAAGPWDFIGHEEVPETKIDGKVARHLDRDDMVMNTMQTFNSLTVQCAQCHNHKFDPISQEDYYSLQAVFAALDRTNVKYDTDPEVARERKRLENERSQLSDQEKALVAEFEKRAGEKLVELNGRISEEEKGGRNNEAFGYHSGIEQEQEITKWVQLDLGKEFVLSKIILHPCKDDFNGIGEGFGFPVRFKIEVSQEEEFRSSQVVVDRRGEDVANPKIKAQEFSISGTGARYVRVTATKLAPRQNDFIFALAEVQVIADEGANVARGAAVSALDSIEAPIRWQKRNLTDGWYPGIPADQTLLAKLRQERGELILAQATAEEKERLEKMRERLDGIKEALSKLPAQKVVYAGAIHHGSGAFKGTGPEGGKPRAIYILNRGNVQSPTTEVVPGALTAISGLGARFNLAAKHVEGERRAELARWITAKENPLTWRSIVNRVWQYHFGRGLVETSNDFGNMGAEPTHPELLDWLAIEFRDGGQSLKKLHKLIVTSATYQQSSEDRAEFTKMDAENRYLWRMNRRKLEAEAVRDSVLSVAGKLDNRMGGPSFQDFVIDKPEHSPHYLYHLQDPEDGKIHRRSIYRFIVRSQQQPFMTTLDCADPSMQVGRRNESVSPLQALAMLNNSLMISMANHFAQRLQQERTTLGAQVEHGFHLALGRPAAPPELKKLEEFAAEHGLANFCRLLYNLNEFSFVD
jgi:hypothetical protein